MRGVREIGRPLSYSETMAQLGIHTTSGTFQSASYATVTEAAILKSKVKDLEADRDALDVRLERAQKDVVQLALTVAAQQSEIAELRRQVKALRDGALLDDPV